MTAAAIPAREAGWLGDVSSMGAASEGRQGARAGRPGRVGPVPPRAEVLPGQVVWEPPGQVVREVSRGLAARAAVRQDLGPGPCPEDAQVWERKRPGPEAQGL